MPDNVTITLMLVAGDLVKISFDEIEKGNILESPIEQMRDALDKLEAMQLEMEFKGKIVSSWR